MADTGLSTEYLAKVAAKEGLDLGDDPARMIRYFTKIGLLPAPTRRGRGRGQGRGIEASFPPEAEERFRQACRIKVSYTGASYGFIAALLDKRLPGDIKWSFWEDVARGRHPVRRDLPNRDRVLRQRVADAVKQIGCVAEALSATAGTAPGLSKNEERREQLDEAVDALKLVLGITLPEGNRAAARVDERRSTRAPARRRR